MSLKPPPRIKVVKREEKEAKLKQFIMTWVERRGADEQRRADRLTCLLVARSAESPVAKAVFALNSEIGGNNLALRVIFATLGSAEAASIAEACTAPELDLQLRWARDLRLMDAHEQLVLSPSATWIGDCMRRDPTKVDAYERFAIDCRETAHLGAIYFERLWDASEPVIERKPAVLPVGGKEQKTEVDASAPGMSQPSEPPSGTLAGTRH
jgi:hypothetical protein